MYNRLLVFFTKILIKILRAMGKNASALPGYILEKLSPNFLTQVLEPVQDKIVLITGTNGKTTSTRMLVHALRENGKRVVTNSTGSNMTRGLISAVVDDMSIWGSLRPTDWFVFEMDEAYAPVFTKGLRVKVVLALNVLRDQLDRYGEIDKTAQLIGEAAKKADIFVYNSHDPLLVKISSDLNELKVKTHSFGVVNKLTPKLKNEQNMFTQDPVATEKPEFALAKSEEKHNRQQIRVQSVDDEVEAELKLSGLHNGLNATAAFALLAQLEPSEYKKIFVAIKTMHPPFGRGEKLSLNNKMVTVALVKNPSGFTHNLETFVQERSPEHILFIVNDKLADGRDVSWLWDVDFKGVIRSKTKITCSGLRAYDIALRLKHDGYQAEVELNVEKAVDILMSGNEKEAVIIPTYTALYEARAALSNYGEVPRIW
jgi:UDP-N-acetylmuramyl tripeptide synthase